MKKLRKEFLKKLKTTWEKNVKLKEKFGKMFKK